VFLAVLNYARGFGGEIQKGADRASSFTTCPQFEHLAEQHEHDDHRRRLEVDADFSAVRERRRKHAESQHRHQAEHIRRAYANGNERKHIQAARHDGAPAALEEQPARPRHDRRREKALRPPRHVARQPFVVTQLRNEVRHCEEEDWQCECSANPEPACHVREFGMFFLDRGHGFRL
jgi:hypothetical protein